MVLSLVPPKVLKYSRSFQMYFHGTIYFSSLPSSAKFAHRIEIHLSLVSSGECVGYIHGDMLLESHVASEVKKSEYRSGCRLERFWENVPGVRRAGT